MPSSFHIAESGIRIAFQELTANRLRTILSLSGITIGIFCIVAIFTVLDAMEQKIKNDVSALGNDVLYVSKWPWMNGHGKWWMYERRPPITMKDLNAIRQKSQTAKFAALLYSDNGLTVSRSPYQIDGVSGYSVTRNFEKIQEFNIAKGRYLTPAELTGGQFKVVLGQDVYQKLFPHHQKAIGHYVGFLGHRFQIVGILQKMGSSVVGVNYDQGMLYSFHAEAALKNVATTGGATLMIKGKKGIPVEELSSETEGILRAERKVSPRQPDNFSINRLNEVTQKLDSVFAKVNVVGSIIAFFSLLVGGFGIANIMFVTVRERTKMIGLKKAIGARSSAILTEFLLEAVILCLLGGFAGILLVFAIGTIVGPVFDLPMTLSFKNFMIGMVISTAVGLISGYLPARAAAKLNPVVAIRSN